MMWIKTMKMPESRWPPRAMVSPRAMSYCDDGSDHAYDDRDYEVDDNTCVEVASWRHG